MIPTVRQFLGGHLCQGVKTRSSLDHGLMGCSRLVRGGLATDALLAFTSFQQVPLTSLLLSGILALDR